MCILGAIFSHLLGGPVPSVSPSLLHPPAPPHLSPLNLEDFSNFPLPKNYLLLLPLTAKILENKSHSLCLMRNHLSHFVRCLLFVEARKQAMGAGQEKYLR